MSISSDYWKRKNSYTEQSKGASKGTSKGAESISSEYWRRKALLDSQQTDTSSDDIGPVNRTYFQKGAFEDGYDFGDILKTYSGTIKDASSNVFAGAAGILENTIDTGASLLSLLPWWKDELSKFVARDLINEEKIGNVAATWGLPGILDLALRASEGESVADVILNSGYEDNSLLGEKADSLAQSAGQLATQAGLQAVGVPWWVTSGVSSYGSQAEQAYQEGATAGEANLSALISAGAEVLTEKFFSAFKFQGKALDEGLTDLISRGVSNKLLKSVLNFGVKAGGESIEEVFSEAASRFGQWLTYQDDKTLTEMLRSEEAIDAYIEAAIGGGLLGGGNTVITSASNAIAGKDPVSGLSATEEQVVRDIYDSRIAEAEADGKKVSGKDKNKLWNDTIEQMDRGEIAIEDIERILGGDTYKSYRETVDSEDAIRNEYKTLRKMERGKMTGEQQDREAELKAMTEELDKSTTRADLAKQLWKETYDTVKGSRLVESYNEKARRSQKFEADVSKYDEKQRKTIQDAIDSGILNNSRMTHEFVDWVAKVAGDKGLEFKFTNNEKLRGTQYEVKTEDGKTRMPNGYRDGNIIGINTNSRKTYEVVAGHEITHVLEGSEFYKALQDSVFRYAVAKDGQANFDKRLKDFEQLYKGVSEDAKGELTAELVGEYLFTDRDFIKRLSTENRNLFQKVYDEIKHMWKLATAGSREKRELERVKKAFEDAYRDTTKSPNKSEAMESEVQHSLSHDSEYMDNAIARNSDLGIVEDAVLAEAKEIRERIAQRMNEIKDKGLVGLPEDIEGNTYIANSSYDGTEENTTICPRSLASEAFVDAVSEYLGRPLTVEEQIYISQDLQGRTLTPECIYCYVATDRKAYRAFLGEYINQRDAVLEKLKANPEANVTRSGELYKEFLNGRKDTKNMYDRFKMWVDASRSGKPMIQASHLANINKLMGDINSEFGAELKPQIVDAMKYAQSASWAKKRIGYVAYNGHILKWKQDRINKLNSHYGLRMYSFSDFHPAFVLENMQMITDASVRGLKMLGYTKDTDFVEIFAPTGMNINISTFGFEASGEVYENNLTGAAWDKAKELRSQYPNVGITFVATNDTLVNWALNQDWIDVVIPYHLVRTGEAVAKAMNYTNYTQESSDKRGENWKKGDKKYIAPTEHNNDKATYLAALERNHLRPRFERFLDNPNYMKLVNECRQPASQSQAVQPIFNEEAANVALAKLEANGYYQPIGGSVDRMYEIAGEVAEAMTQDIGPVAKPKVQYSLDIEYADGTVEELADLRNLTDEQAISYLESAKSGDLIDETYIPVRSDLPQVIIDTLEQVEEYLENRSLIMEVNKARRLMRPDKNRGSSKRGHSLSPAQIVEIIKDIENPVKMFYQTNRVDRDGNPLPNNVAIFVKYSKNGVNGFATVEFENPERTEVIGLEQGETNFYTVNTAFFPDTIKDGKPFNYLEKLRNNLNNIELEIKRRQPEDSTIWKKHPSTINELPSGNILPDIAPEVKGNSLAEADDIGPVRNTERRQPEGSATGEIHPNTSNELPSADKLADIGPVVKQYSLSEDSDYLDAVDRGDMETAQMMVDKAARSAGYTIEAYHGTNEDFTVFDKNRIGKGIDKYGAGFYFGNHKGISESYGTKNYPVYLKLEKPIRIRSTQSGGEDLRSVRITKKQAADILKRHPLMYSEDSPLGDFYEEFWETGAKAWMIQDLAGKYRNLGDIEGDFFKAYPNEFHEAVRDVTGYDGVEVYLDYGNFYEEQSDFFYVAWFDNQMKSSEPVVQDDSGNVIPLSERFNSEDSDIRYSLSSENDQPTKHGNYHVRGEDILLQPPFLMDDDIGPVAPSISERLNGDIGPVNKPKESRNITKDSRFVPGRSKEPGMIDWAKEHLLDNGMVFEEVAKATGNRELEGLWNFTRNAPSAAQNLIGEGDKAHGIRPLKSIMDEVDNAGKTESFNDYLLHFHNFDRMSLESRFPGSYNKPVFGDRVTAEESMKRVEELEKANPEFKGWAKEVYKINDYLRDKLVDAGIVPQDTAEQWAEMYPHYVPVYREGENGFSINGSKNLGVNAPVKRATGGNSKPMNVLKAMGTRTLQTYKAVAMNNFGVELMNTLGSVVESNPYGIDEFTGEFDMDTMFGQNGNVPTYTVYQDGQRVTFEITEQMYEAMKPKSGITQKKIPVLSHINSIFRGLTTQYNPVFAFTNPIKDIQEVLLNSQHPGKTYLSIPKAIKQMVTKGKYYQEYLANGGKANTYFDNESKTFTEEPKAKQFLDKVFAFNDYIEMTPRLAEYIVSRESGRSIEVSMLDAARVTTNFSAGGDVTKFFNRNGVTFLNASVQGAIQQVRNVKEASQKGLMGYVGLATRWAIGGLVPVLLNNLLWDDDEEYEDLADYVKQDYYIIGKYGDGQFIRIPKGRALAVLQEAMDIVVDTATGDDEVDMARYLALGAMAIENLAPNNPMDNNIIAPIMQVAENKTWYGEDLIPSRLADLPAAEQYDEKTDAISKWLGETFNLSPYKINYLLNQYSGGIGDFFLPMLTPKAESGDDSFLGNMIAPMRDKFTTDSVINSQTVSDFYDTQDELEINANSRNATEEDAFKYMYMRSISFETSDLYKQKREIQSSDLPDSEKYQRVREIQAQINALMEEALSNYNDPHIDGVYAEVGNRRYNYDAESGNWYEIKPQMADGSDSWYYQMEQEVTKALGLSYGEYWNNREEYNFAYQKPGKYAISQAVGGYETYQGYSDALYNIRADKDRNGKSISGSRKTKVIEYVDGLDCDYGMKIILFKSEYPSDDTYNEDIIEYLNDRDDISYRQMEAILKELGFKVDSDGNITW